MKHKVAVLGCGMVGATIARDLASDDDFDVTVSDVNAAALARFEGDSAIRTIRADLADVGALAAAIEPADIVVGALPSRIGFQALEIVIEAGKSYCDISFMPEDPLALADLARERGVTAVVDCGVSPGLSNMIVGYADRCLGGADSARIYVGGLPTVRTWPYDYKAPFAPADVLEEYTRPARIVESGRVVTRPALSEPELIDFPRIGTLEAFNTDGLRTLIATLEIPDMREKTLRYPGHIDLMRAMRDTGLFGKEPIEVGGVLVRPLDVTSKLLFPKWSYEDGEEEFTTLRVEVEGVEVQGVEAGLRVQHVYDLYDKTDAASGTSSMARTTGFPAAIVARMIARGQFREPGVTPPELLARREGIFDKIISELRQRGVDVTHRVQAVSS